MDRLKLSDNIIRLRHERKITQEELADFLGVTKASMRKSNKLDYIFGRRYRYGIRNTQRITTICTPCSEDGIDVKSQAYGNKERY